MNLTSNVIIIIIINNNQIPAGVSVRQDTRMAHIKQIRTENSIKDTMKETLFKVNHENNDS